MKKEDVSYYIRKYQDDYNFKTYSSALLGSLVDFFFIFYNAFIAFTKDSIWHHSIWFYYLLLCLVRALLIHARKTEEHKYSLIKFTGFLMILIIFSLSFPIYVLINGMKSFSSGLIEAIIIATYTTVKITLAIRHVLKAKNTKDSLIIRLRAISLMDALFSILILQNTLIMAVDGKVEGPMIYVSIVSSSIISLMIAFISIYSVIKS